MTGPSDSDCGKDCGSPARAVHRRNSLTPSEQEELRSLRQRFRVGALWSLLAKQEDADVFEGLENIPKESIHERIVEQRQYIDKVVEAPVVQSMPEHVEVAKTFPQERISEHTQTVNVPVPQIAVPVPFHKETDEVILPVTAECTSVCTVAEIVGMPVPQIQEQIVEVAETIPQERTSEHTVEQIAGVLVPRVQERILEVAEMTD